MIQFLSLSLFPLLLTVAATADVLSRRIPNPLIIALLVCFFPVAWFSGMATDQIALHAGTAICVLFIGYVLFSCGLCGGGDAKLIATAALWLGPAGVVPMVVLTVLAGGLLSLVVMLWSLVNMEAELRDSKLLSRLGWIRPKVPYGYAIAAGSLLAFGESWWGTLSLS
jgi:prepilin peptidase CpaA